MIEVPNQMLSILERDIVSVMSAPANSLFSV
jgi:hypothetical protein